MPKRLIRRPSAPMVVSSLALFVALGGVGYAATGGNFILGQSNSATSATTLVAPVATAALKVSNQSTDPNAVPLTLTAAANHAPLKVDRSTKVANLNVDWLDNLDASAFLRRGVAQTNNVSAAGGVVDVTNTGTTNGVQGKTTSPTASGVYGQNDAGGFGVAGRSLQSGGVGVLAEGNTHAIVATSNSSGAAIDATNSNGPALALHSSGAPMTVDDTTKVANLNADQVDGASIVSNRVVSTTQGDHILDLPGFGFIYVDGCDHTNTRWIWTSNGTGNAYVTVFDLANPGDGLFQGAFSSIVSATRPHKYDMLQLARNTGGATSIAQVTLSTDAAPCVFAASAVVQPG